MTKTAIKVSRRGVLAASLMALALLAAPSEARAHNLQADARAALESLYSHSEGARLLAEKAKAVLVFPRIYKAGFIVGGAYGEGVLFRGGKMVGRYNSVMGSYGFQAGAQTYGYAMFLLTDSAISYLDKSEGFEIGVGPTVVVVDKGMGAKLTSSTLQDDIYAFVFNQKGLMAGVSIEGSKITRLKD